MGWQAIIKVVLAVFPLIQSLIVRIGVVCGIEMHLTRVILAWAQTIQAGYQRVDS